MIFMMNAVSEPGNVDIARQLFDDMYKPDEVTIAAHP